MSCNKASPGCSTYGWVVSGEWYCANHFIVGQVDMVKQLQAEVERLRGVVADDAKALRQAATENADIHDEVERLRAELAKWPDVRLADGSRAYPGQEVECDGRRGRLLPWPPRGGLVWTYNQNLYPAVAYVEPEQCYPVREQNNSAEPPK